jgi:hypothetical protein
MNKRSLINEEEKLRILNLHETRKSKEWNLVSEQVDVTGNQGKPVVGATPAGPSIANTATQTAPTNTATPVTPETPTTPTTSATTPSSESKVLNDRDYYYKKEGDKYFFKLQANPGSDAAKKFKAANKFVNWTEATGKGLEAIKKLNWGQSEKLAIATPTKVQSTQAQAAGTNQPQLAGTQPTSTQQPVASGGGGNSLPGLNNIQDEKIKASVLAWSKTPAGQYVIKSTPEQREAALDNLDRVRGDKETRRLKKEIRTALGMMADTGLGRLGQKVQGAVQGAKQGFQNPIPPAK